jgi:putative membrane protein
MSTPSSIPTLAAIVFAVASASGAQSPSAAHQDAAFMKDAAADGMAEVELGKLAESKATRADVKAFAQMMVNDHSKANDELKGLADQKKVDLPDDPKPEHKATRDRLEKMSGDAFDRAYLDHMVKDHEKAVNLFSRESKSGHDADVKAWAGKTLPTLQAHLAQVRSLAGARTGSNTSR